MSSGTSALNVPQSSSSSSVPSSPARPKAGTEMEKDKNGGVASKGLTPEDITSPYELTAYVETLLDSLESKFDDMSSQILDRMSQMSSRVDSLEASLHDIINGDITTGGSTSAGGSIPHSPTPGPQSAT